MASGLPATTWRFVGFLPRKRGELEALFRGAGETLVAFESPRRVGASLEVLAAVDPARAGGGLPRADQAARGDRARDARRSWRPRYAEEEPRGEIVVVVGGAPAEEADLGPALDALRGLVEAGAKARPAATVVAELTGASANALYKALHER